MLFFDALTTLRALIPGEQGKAALPRFWKQQLALHLRLACDCCPANPQPPPHLRTAPSRSHTPAPRTINRGRALIEPRVRLHGGRGRAAPGPGRRAAEAAPFTAPRPLTGRQPGRAAHARRREPGPPASAPPGDGASPPPRPPPPAPASARRRRTGSQARRFRGLAVRCRRPGPIRRRLRPRCQPQGIAARGGPLPVWRRPRPAPASPLPGGEG